ncbi:MAG: YfcE family phosphodiesterase [Oscillibacter sp.]|jgi:putative phosphoesterase|nr:YfcE family phosphodiesterase [Oscillibacter sp.]
MQILVLSDSHGNVSNMIRAVELVQPQKILHLGDCWRDGVQLHEAFPDIPFEQVPGNCDYQPDEPTEKLLTEGGLRILMCHGHTYHVKSSLLTAGCAAAEKELDLFLFGHTHCPYWDLRGRTQFLNPGSIGASWSAPTYGLVRIERGVLTASVQRLEAQK